MPRRIILHAGFHKTGSTTVQDTLRENRAALKSHVALRLPWHLRDVTTATRAYAKDRDPQILETAQEHFDQLLSALPGMPKRTLIISGDDLAGGLPCRNKQPDYAMAPVLLYALWDCARARFPAADVMIHLATRTPVAWLRSVYRDKVRNGSLTLDFDLFSKRFSATAALADMATEIASRVPCPVHVTSLEDSALLSLGPAAPLLDLCDLPEDLRRTLVPGPLPVPALPDTVTEALLEANRTYDVPAQRAAVKTRILAQAGLA